MITFGDLKNSSVVNISGVSPNSDDFRRLVNESTKRLMKRGDWDGTIVPYYTCVSPGSCVVWNRYVGHVRQLNYCGRHVPITNISGDFLPYDRGYPWSANSWWGWGDGLPYGGSRMVNQSRSPVFQDVQGDGRTIRAYPATPQDNNKTITLFGEDNNGQPLTTTGAGPWASGIKLSLQTPYAETPINVRRIDRVLKDATTGPVRLYAWNSSASVLEDVAYYEPSETRPNYLRSRLSLPCTSSTGCDGSTNNLRTIIALVKLAFVPVVADTDLVIIDDVTALKHAIQCIKCEESQDVETGRAFLDMAVDELNRGLQDANPDTQIPVDFGELGHNQHHLGRQNCF